MDRIIDHLNLMFLAEKLPPSRVFCDVALTAAEESGGIDRVLGPGVHCRRGQRGSHRSWIGNSRRPPEKQILIFLNTRLL